MNGLPAAYTTADHSLPLGTFVKTSKLVLFLKMLYLTMLQVVQPFAGILIPIYSIDRVS